MDVTLLLNQSAGSNDKGVSRESTPASAAGGASTLPSTALPTPSPERSLPPREGEERYGAGRTSWGGGGGYSLPLHSETKFRSHSVFSFRSASEQLDPDTAYHTTAGAGMHARNGTTDSDLTLRHAKFFTRPHPFRTANLDSDRRPADCSDKRPPFWDERRGSDYQSLSPPRHQLWNGHGSVSSYGSWQSRPHSRISSVTTVSGGHPGGPSLAESPILEIKLAEHDEPGQQPLRRAGETPLAAMARYQLPVPIGADEAEQPRSPSDAVLNMRGLARHGQPIRQPFHRVPHLFSSSKLHKRATSAPDLAPANTRRQLCSILPPPHRAMAISASSPPAARGVSVSLATCDGRERQDMANARGSEPEPRSDRARSMIVGLNPSPELASHGASQSTPSPSKDGEANACTETKGEPRCMFVSNCDTGSQLRKAISHLFGRNKSCTLKIPKEVWVYYCRKHYQRIRYRNARTYPSNQMELVKVQIRRLQTWSETNKAQGSGPYIKQWTLSLRKREQTRLENGKGTIDEGDDDNGGAPGGSAVPDWIIQLLGDGQATETMLDVAERLHKDIAEGVLSQVPEIEFLPDIVDDDGGAPAKTARARRQNSSGSGSKTPKRKASDVSSLSRQDCSRQNSANSDGLLSDRQGGEDGDAAEHVSPSGKRARIDRGSGVSYLQSSDASNPRAGHAHMTPTYGAGRAGNSIPHRGRHDIPMMRPLVYSQNMAQGECDHQGQPHPGGQVHHAFYSQGASPGYAARFLNSHGSVDAQLTLPSISSHVASGGNGHRPCVPNIVYGARLADDGAPRSMHQRSASAYTLANRHMPASTRPSSSGNVAHAGLPRFSVGDAGAAMYGMGSHSPPSLGGGHWAAQQYGQGQHWGPDYGHGFSLQQNPLPQTPMYGQAHHQDMVSPRSGPSYGMAGTLPAVNGVGEGA